MEKNYENNQRSLSSVLCSEIIFHKFITNPNLSYYECAEAFLTERNIYLNKKRLKEFCFKNIYFQQIAYIREILCLVQNGVKRGRVNLEAPTFVDSIKDLKEKTIVSGDKNITNYNYIKAIRNVLAHNDELEEESLIQYDVIGGENKVVVNARTEGLTIELTMADLHNICGAIFKSINKSQGLGIYSRRLENAIVGGYFDVENIGRYMNGFNGGEYYEFKLDEFQKKSLQNFVKSGDVQDDKVLIIYKYRNDDYAIRLAYPELVEQVFPFQSKPEDLAFHKCFMFHINNLIVEDLNRRKDDIVDMFNVSPQLLKIFPTFCVNSDYAGFLMTTNGLYSIMSDRKLEDIEPEFIETLGNENARHIRNALQHGTYYYNFNNGVEIYDGGKKLKHITTLDLSKTTYNMHRLVFKRFKSSVQEAE